MILSWNPFKLCSFLLIILISGLPDISISTSTQNSAFFVWIQKYFTPSSKGAMLLQGLFLQFLFQVMSIGGHRISPFRTWLNALAKGIFLEGNARWKSCKSRGSVILQILIIPVKPAALQGFSRSVSESVRARLVSHTYECLWVCNVYQLLSYIEMQTDEMSVLLSNSVEPSRAHAF